MTARQYVRDLLRPGVREGERQRGIPFTEDEFEQVVDAHLHRGSAASAAMIKWLVALPAVYQSHQRRLAPLRSVSAAYKQAQIPAHFRKDTGHEPRKSTEKAARRTPQAPDPRGDGGTETGDGGWEPISRYFDLGHATSTVYSPADQYNAQQALGMMTPGGITLLNGLSSALLFQAFQPLAQRPKADPLPTEVKAGELVAWRCWRELGKGRDGKLRLASRFASDYWRPGVPLESTKEDLESGLGIHAWKTRQQAEDYARGERDLVVGSVELWGTVYEHAEGYRAQFASIKSLDKASRFGALRPLQEAYGVHVTAPMVSDPMPRWLRLLWLRLLCGVVIGLCMIWAFGLRG